MTSEKQISLIKSLVLPLAVYAGLGRIVIDYIAKLIASGPIFYYSTYFICFILEIFLITYIIKRYKGESNNNFTLKEGLKISVATMLIIGLIFAVYSFLYNSYIDPDFQTNMAIAWGELFGQGQAVKEEISKNQLKNSPSGIFYVMLQFIFLGFIIGMILSSILKTKQNHN